MKCAAYVLLGAVAGLFLGTLASVAFNHWYAGRYIRGDDDANFLVSLLLFRFWPLFAVVGSAGGYWLYRRRQHLMRRDMPSPRTPGY